MSSGFLTGDRTLWKGSRAAPDGCVGAEAFYMTVSCRNSQWPQRTGVQLNPSNCKSFPTNPGSTCIFFILPVFSLKIKRFWIFEVQVTKSPPTCKACCGRAAPVYAIPTCWGVTRRSVPARLERGRAGTLTFGPWPDLHITERIHCLKTNVGNCHLRAPG